MSEKTENRPGDAAGALELEYDAFGRLAVVLPDGRRLERVIPVRCFPHSSPSEWIAFCDDSGRELYTLPSMGALGAKARELLERDLALREFIPEIKRIRSVSGTADPTVWKVETDRGETEFTLVSEDHIRRLGADGALITDSHGVRYRIQEVRALDASSRRILNRYL